jgi:2-dehydropantoate 2-reductase
MGTILGALLTKSGFDVTLVDINNEHINALQKDGAVITGTINEKVPVKACTPDKMAGRYDLFFLFTKQTANEAAFSQIERHMHDNSLICTLQNGIPEFALAERFGVDRTMGCAVTWAATLLRPGVTQANTKLEFWHSNMGRIDRKCTPELEAVREILSAICRTEITGNLIGMRWSKLLVNSSFSGMSAVLDCTFGEILDNPISLCCAQYIARECIHVARKAGYRMEPLAEGEDFERQLDFSSDGERGATIPIYHKLFGASSNALSSMLQDLRNGRKTEIDAINGLVSKFGRCLSVPTPFCDLTVKIIKDIEKGHRKAGPENLSLFSELLE